MMCRDLLTTKNLLNDIFSAGSRMTSARRLAANAEEKPLDIPTVARKGPPVEFLNDDLVFHLNIF